MSPSTVDRSDGSRIFLTNKYRYEANMKAVSVSPDVFAVLLIALASFVHTAAAQTQTFPTSAGPVKITPLNHASTLIEAGGKVLYLDPAKPAKLADLPKADLILITDIHGDHMDPDSIKAVSKAGTEIFAAPAVVQTVTTAKPIANGETKVWGAFSIEAIPAYNLKRGPAPGKFFHDKGRGNGYVLNYGGKRFYFSGDTEVTHTVEAFTDPVAQAKQIDSNEHPDQRAAPLKHSRHPAHNTVAVHADKRQPLGRRHVCPFQQQTREHPDSCEYADRNEGAVDTQDAEKLRQLDVAKEISQQ